MLEPEPIVSTRDAIVFVALVAGAYVLAISAIGAVGLALGALVAW